MIEAKEIPMDCRAAMHRILHAAAARTLGREIGSGRAVLYDALLDAFAQAGTMSLTERERNAVGGMLGHVPFLFCGLVIVFDGEGMRNG